MGKRDKGETEIKAPKLDYSTFDKGQNFLVKYLRMALECNVISNVDKLRQFPPDAIAEGYDLEHELMAYVMGGLFTDFPQATIRKLIERGLHTEIIQTALDAGDITPDMVFKLMPEAEMVRVLHNPSIWQLVENTGWYRTDTPEHQAFAAYLLEQYIEEKLGTESEDRWSKLVDDIGIEQMMLDNVPASIRSALLKCAYHLGKKGNPTTAEALLKIFPPKRLVKHIPLVILARPLHAAAVMFAWMNAANVPVQEKLETPPADGTADENDAPPPETGGADAGPAATPPSGDAASERDVDDDCPTGLPPPSAGAAASGPPPLPPQRTPGLRADDDVEELVEARIDALIREGESSADEPEVTTEGTGTGELGIDLTELEKEKGD